MAGYIPINVPQRPPSGPFGPDFFKRKFHQFISESCSVADTTTVLEIVLASGQILDVSHFEDFDAEYMLLSCFVDERTCDSTYHTYIRYDSIFRVNVYEQELKERPVGFNFATYAKAASLSDEDALLSTKSESSKK